MPGMGYWDVGLELAKGVSRRPYHVQVGRYWDHGDYDMNAISAEAVLEKDTNRNLIGAIEGGRSDLSLPIVVRQQNSDLLCWLSDSVKLHEKFWTDMDIKAVDAEEEAASGAEIATALKAAIHHKTGLVFNTAPEHLKQGGAVHPRRPTSESPLWVNGVPAISLTVDEGQITLWVLDRGANWE